MPTAFLVDGGYFVKRYRAVYPNAFHHDAHTVAKNLFTACIQHLEDDESRQKWDLYRILFYDCPPLTKKAHLPISGKAIDFALSKEAKFRVELHEELKKLRKVALRLGHLSEWGGWIIKPESTKDLLSGALKVADLKDSDLRYEVRQKAVDMKIGLDVASLSYKRLVDQIVLIAGDADFVPAAKLARREGIDFILDPMWKPIPATLFEHIDGLHSTWPKPGPQHAQAVAQIKL